MEKTELVALAIVGIAVILLLFYFFRKKGGGGCGTNCFRKLSGK